MSLTLTNYWWLLIWLFVGGAICSYFPKRREVLGDQVVTRWDIWPAIILVLPYIIWAGYRGNVADTKLYRAGFFRTPSSLASIPTTLSSDIKDPGFTVLVTLIKLIIGEQDTAYFLIIAALQLLCMAFIYRKYSSNYWLCIFLFIASTDYMSWVFNGMRQFVAVTVIFACFEWLLKKKYIPLVAVILLVSTIHGSAIMMIPIVFIVQGKAWNFKTMLMMLATVVVVVFIDRFTPIMNDLLQDTQYDDALSDSMDDGTNAIRVLVYSVPALLSLVGLKYVRAADDPVINICVNCSIATMAIYLVSMVTSGIYIGRLPIYTTLHGYMAVPWLIDNIFEKRSAKLVTYIMVVMFCAFFYFQMGFTWNYL